MPAPPAAPPPQTFPYDYLFKVLIIGDASVGKVSFPNARMQSSESIASLEHRTNIVVSKTVHSNGKCNLSLVFYATSVHG